MLKWGPFPVWIMLLKTNVWFSRHELIFICDQYRVELSFSNYILYMWMQFLRMDSHIIFLLWQINQILSYICECSYCTCIHIQNVSSLPHAMAESLIWFYHDGSESSDFILAGQPKSCKGCWKSSFWYQWLGLVICETVAGKMQIVDLYFLGKFHWPPL